MEYKLTGKILTIYFETTLTSMDEKKAMKKWNRFLLERWELFLSNDLKRHLKGVKKIEVAINIIGDQKMRKINVEYRGKDKTTDVLSFPIQENLRAGITDCFAGQMQLGDLLISKNVCEKQAKQFKLTFYEEYAHLATHGFLHLLGYDHEISDAEEKLMQSLEEKILKRKKN